MVCLLETKQNDIVRWESVVKLLLYRACMSTLSRQRNKNNSVVAMTSNRTVVASLVCLVVFCQRYWNSIGDVLQSTWLKIINVCGDDDESLYFYGVAIGINVFYWMVASVFLFFDITNRPKWMRQFKVQPGTHEPVDMKRLIKAAKNVLFNQFVVGLPLIFIGSRLRRQRATPPVHILPSFQTFILQWIFFSLVDEVSYYYLHRLMHHRLFYKFTHKQHHEWTAPIVLAALYTSPWEHIVNSLTPSLGPAIITPHVATLLLFIFVSHCRNLKNHTGYDFFFIPSPLDHDWHHTQNIECFGKLGLMDYLHGTDKLFRASKARKLKKVE